MNTDCFESCVSSTRYRYILSDFSVLSWTWQYLDLKVDIEKSIGKSIEKSIETSVEKSIERSNFTLARALPFFSRPVLVRFLYILHRMYRACLVYLA